MKDLSKNELLFVAGGAGKSETHEGLLSASLDVAPHLEESSLSVMLVLRDPLAQNSDNANKIKC